MTLGVGEKVSLYPVPKGFIVLALSVIGKKNMANQLYVSLVVGATKARLLLDWDPSVTTEETLKKAGLFLNRRVAES